jgi:MFS family permease
MLVAPGAILLGPLLGQALVTNWFDARRGRALGIVSAGTTVGGMLMPPLAAALIEGIGWRGAMATLGGLSILIVLPLVRFLVRDRPEETSESAEGMNESSNLHDSIKSMEPADTRTLLRNPSLWLVGITFGLVFSAGLISTIFMIPYAGELGIPLLGGSLIASARAGAGAFGKIVFGSLSDRLGVRRVLFGVIGTEVLLTGILVQTREPVVFIAVGVAIGFVGGSPLPLKAAMTGQIFGRSNFPAAMGLLQTVAVPFQLCMVPLAGAIYQYAENYAAVFALTLPCFILGAITLYFVPLPPAESTPPR